jgi:hypothetical protein
VSSSLLSSDGSLLFGIVSVAIHRTPHSPHPPSSFVPFAYLVVLLLYRVGTKLFVPMLQGQKELLLVVLLN